MCIDIYQSVRRQVNRSGTNLLHWAIWSGSIEAIEWVVARGTFAVDYTDGDKAERVPAASMRLRDLENTRGIQAEMMRVRMERLAREQQC